MVEQFEDSTDERELISDIETKTLKKRIRLADSSVSGETSSENNKDDNISKEDNYASSDASALYISPAYRRILKKEEERLEKEHKKAQKKYLSLLPTFSTDESGSEELLSFAHRRKVPGKKNILTMKEAKPIILPSYKVMLTRFTARQTHKIGKTICDLGGSINEEEGNILVSANLNRSMKSLQCASLGIPIVSPAWVTDSSKYGKFLDPMEYIHKSKIYTYADPPIQFLKNYIVVTSTRMQKQMLENIEKLIRLNGGVHLKMEPGEYAPVKFEKDKVLSLYFSKHDDEINLPSPKIELVEFFKMIIRQKLNLAKAIA